MDLWPLAHPTSPSHNEKNTLFTRQAEDDCIAYRYVYTALATVFYLRDCALYWHVLILWRITSFGICPIFVQYVFAHSSSIPRPHGNVHMVTHLLFSHCPWDFEQAWKKPFHQCYVMRQTNNPVFVNVLSEATAQQIATNFQKLQSIIETVLLSFVVWATEYPYPFA